jgi:hypothetical protein
MPWLLVLASPLNIPRSLISTHTLKRFHLNGLEKKRPSAGLSLWRRALVLYSSAWWVTVGESTRNPECCNPGLKTTDQSEKIPPEPNPFGSQLPVFIRSPTAGLGTKKTIRPKSSPNGRASTDGFGRAAEIMFFIGLRDGLT